MSTMNGQSRRGANPPPVCFNCGQEGHFVVACPAPSRLNSGAFPVPQTPQPQQAAYSHPPQQYVQNPPPPQYPPQQQYQQNQQYSAPSPYPYSQPPTPHPYSGSPAFSPYAPQPYPAAPYNQYPAANGPPQYGSSGYNHPPPQYAPPTNIPYQQTPTHHQPPNASYNGQHGYFPSLQQGPQWNHTPPTSSTAPPFQRPQRSVSHHREDFNATGHHSQKQTQRPRQVSDAVQLTPQPSPASASNSQQAPSRSTLSEADETPAKNVAGSVSADTLNAPLACTLSNEQQHGSKQEVDVAKTEAIVQPASSNEAVAKPVDCQTEFLWDLEHIFKDPPSSESVALAQPLAMNFETVPVPLLDVRPTSVSRLARNDNLKEFVRNIRSSPQWSYLQQDPAFADINFDAPLLPRETFPAWWEKRQGIIYRECETATSESGGKRSWSQAQDDADSQHTSEAQVEESESRASKRQRHDGDDDNNERMVDLESGETVAPDLGTPIIRTPVLGRSGTPTLEDVDDAWKPSPGEESQEPREVNLAEAVLASLGVTGSPKPVGEESLPPYFDPVEDQLKPQPEIPDSSNKSDGPPVSDEHGKRSQDLSQAAQVEPQQNHDTQVSNQWGHQSGPLRGHSTNDVQHHGPPTNPSPANASFNNGPNIPPHACPPSVPWSNPQQTGAPIHGPYQNGPSNQMHFPHPQTGPQPSAPFPTQHTHYSPSYYNNFPPQNNQYDGQQQYGAGPSHQHPWYSANVPDPQYGNPQFAQGQAPAPPQYMNGHQTPYNAPYRNSQYEYSQPHQPQWGDYQQGPQQYAVNYQYQAPYPNAPQGQAHYGEYQHQPQFINGQHGPPQASQYTGKVENPPNSYNHQPPRQDSGYMSARGSYSAGSGQKDCNSSTNDHQSEQVPTNDEAREKEKSPAKVPKHTESSGESVRSCSSEPGTPLSPTSAEILGKLKPKPPKKRLVPGSQSNGTNTAIRKVRRAQPVVADAYSRRW